MNKAVFRFSSELNVFLKPTLRGQDYEYEFNGPQSVKHLIEAAGVPHTEVSSIWVNGNPVSFSYQVENLDQVEILPFSYYPSEVSQSQNEPLFILDNHLGKLASHLRMLGFDCLYKNSFQDDELAQTSQDDDRILLTRDHRLLMRSSVKQGYWLRSQDPRQQLIEVLLRYALFEKIKPFQRCMRCNQLLIPVSKVMILHRLLPLTIKYFDEFRICPDCTQVYWQGSHNSKMLSFIQEIIQGYQYSPLS